jgi:GT2 family glycosyltransferase
VGAASDFSGVAESPSFSVVVPTKNRPLKLRECLRAVASLDYAPSRLEVVIVDDGSATARAIGEGTSLEHVTVVDQPSSGPAAARNRGAAVAGGTCVAFLDDDCTPTAAWLAELADVLTGLPNAIVGGPTVNALTQNPFAVATQLVVDYLIAAESEDVAFLPSSNLALSREAFLELGGFDTNFTDAGGEDREFCARARARGYQLRLAQRAIVYHRHELGPTAFWRQHYRYGRGAYRFRRMPQHGPPKLVPERPSFYTRLVTSAADRPRRITLSTLLAVSQLATLCGVVREALTGRRPAGPMST